MTIPDETGAGISATAQLSVAIGDLTTELATERRRKLQLTQDVAYIEAPPITGTSVPLSQAGWGPNTGYAWAVQRITVAGLGATTDLLTAYRGNAVLPNGQPPQNALYSFTIAAAGAVATWHPGRTGLILQAEESMIFTGTFTGTQLAISLDVIQLHGSKLPYFLL